MVGLGVESTTLSESDGWRKGAASPVLPGSRRWALRNPEDGKCDPLAPHRATPKYGSQTRSRGTTLRPDLPDSCSARTTASLALRMYTCRACGSTCEFDRRTCSCNDLTLARSEIAPACPCNSTIEHGCICMISIQYLSVFGSIVLMAAIATR